MPYQRLLALVSLAGFSFLILVYLWWGKFHYSHQAFLYVTYAGAAVIILINHFVFGDNRRTMGFRLDNFASAAPRYGLPTLLIAIVITGTGFVFGSPRIDRWGDLSEYAIWALVQQHVLQNFIRLRSETLVGWREGTEPKLIPQPASAPTRLFAAIFLAAALFSMFHAPNFALMLLTFCGGLLWCSLYSRTPNFLWSWFSHATLATLVLLFFKYETLNQFQVGSPHFRYEGYGDGAQVAGGRDANGRPWIATLPGPDKNSPALVRIFTPQGERIREWNAFERFEFSGVLASGDLGFSPGDELVVVPGPGQDNPPNVRIFDSAGNLLKEFRASNINQGYGAWAAIGCGKLYLCPGPGPGNAQQVVEFNLRGEMLQSWDFKGTGLLNGLRVVPVCSNFLTGTASGGDQDLEASSLLLWGSVIPVNPSTVFSYNTRTGQLTSWETLRTTYGLNATLARLASGGLGLAVAPGYLQGYPAWVRIFDLNGNQVGEFWSQDQEKSCGSNIAALDIDGDSIDELILGEGACPGQPSRVRIYRWDGILLHEWSAYENSR